MLLLVFFQLLVVFVLTLFQLGVYNRRFGVENSSISWYELRVILGIHSYIRCMVRLDDSIFSVWALFIRFPELKLLHAMLGHIIAVVLDR